MICHGLWGFGTCMNLGGRDEESLGGDLVAGSLSMDIGISRPTDFVIEWNMNMFCISIASADDTYFSIVVS